MTYLPLHQKVYLAVPTTDLHQTFEMDRSANDFCDRLVV